MEMLGSLWTCQEQNENIDELKQKLSYAALELESFKMEGKEEIVRNEENTRNLVNLLNSAYRERDEARDQLQKILHKLAASAVIPKEVLAIISHIHPESPILLKANSTITESDSFSETHNNHHSHYPSPADSFLDTVSSPELSNINVVDSCITGFPIQPLEQDYNCFVSFSPPILSLVKKKTDPADALIDNLVRGKSLPLKGNLLQAVIEAGTTLQTLLVAGSLPSWRNPPPAQTLKIPPLNLEICETTSNDQIHVASISYTSQKVPCTSSFISQSLCRFLSCSASTMNFSNDPYNSILSSANCGVTMNNQVPVSKRQRLQ